jgi:ABC-2 type transport system permease protein
MFQSGKALRSALIWGGSVSIYVVLVTSVLNEVRDSLIELLNGSELIRNLYPVSTASFENLLGVSMFLVLVGVITAFAVTQVAGWTSEENEGRLELVLSTPAPRRTLLFSNYLVTLVASAFMLAIPGVAFAITAYLSNISINAGNALGGFFGLWVVAAVISGAGFLLAALKPGPAAAVLGGIVVLMFLADLLENVLKLPEWVVNLSVFQHLGQPLTEGLNWTANSVMLALAVVFIGAATIIFWRRDIVK